MKVTHLASAVAAAALLLPLAWAPAPATAAVATTSGGGGGVVTLDGELSPAAAALVAAGASASPPIAESRGKAVEYSRQGAAAPLPPPRLAPSLAAAVAEKAKAVAKASSLSSSETGVGGEAGGSKKKKRKAAKAGGRLPRGVSRAAVAREVAAKAAVTPIDAEVEAKMTEVRTAMDRIAPAAGAGAAKRGRRSKGGSPKGAAKAAALAAGAATTVVEEDRATLRKRLAALEVAVAKVHQERDELRILHSYAAEENRQLTIKLHEVQLALQSASRASGAANPALSRWLSAKEVDLSAFVAGTAYEYYTRSSYGPLTAALISYGVLLGPLAAAGLFFLRHAKALSGDGSPVDLLTGVQAMSIFDAAFALALVAAIFVARLGDPLLALRDIAPPLFVFLFLAVGAQTVASVAAVGLYLKRSGGVRGHARVAWALGVKLVMAADFFGRMGMPALLGKHYIAPVPIGVYLAYVAATTVSLGLVHRTRKVLARTEAP